MTKQLRSTSHAAVLRATSVLTSRDKEFEVFWAYFDSEQRYWEPATKHFVRMLWEALRHTHLRSRVMHPDEHVDGSSS